MEEEIKITDRTTIIIGNLGKLIYRSFIVGILYDIYTHLMGETMTLAVCTFLLMFPLIWMTMKELYIDLDYHDNKKKLDNENEG